MLAFVGTIAAVTTQPQLFGKDFADIDSPESRLFHLKNQLTRILEIRVKFCAFHPNGGRKVLMVSSHVFTLLRISQKLTRTGIRDESTWQTYRAVLLRTG